MATKERQRQRKRKTEKEMDQNRERDSLCSRSQADVETQLHILFIDLWELTDFTAFLPMTF